MGECRNRPWNRQPGIPMVLQSILNGVHRLGADERGAVAVTMGMLIIPLVGALAIGFEVSNWYMVTRNMQNAADAATIAAAIAKAATRPEDICMLALASSGVAQGIRTNGSPTADMNGCNVMSNTAAQCNGSNLGAGLGMAHGNSNGCGVTQVSNVPVVTDPYIGLASNIPPLSSAGCGGSYPQESKHGNAYSVTASN